MGTLYTPRIKYASPRGMAAAAPIWHSMPMPTLGERIRKARKAAGLTQEALAERVGVKQPQVPRWEKNLTIPSLEHLKSVAEVLDASVAWLLYGDAQLREHHANASIPPLRVGGVLVPMVTIQDAAERKFDNPQSLMNPVAPISGDAAIIVVNDDSNEPAHPIGSLWALAYDEKPKPGDMVLGRHGADLEPILGQYSIASTASGRVTMIVPLNSVWPAARSDLEHVEVVAVMVADIRAPRR